MTESMTPSIGRGARVPRVGENEHADPMNAAAANCRRRRGSLARLVPSATRPRRRRRRSRADDDSSPSPSRSGRSPSPPFCVRRRERGSSGEWPWPGGGGDGGARSDGDGRRVSVDPTTDRYSSISSSTDVQPHREITAAFYASRRKRRFRPEGARVQTRLVPRGDVAARRRSTPPRRVLRSGLSPRPRGVGDWAERRGRMWSKGGSSRRGWWTVGPYRSRRTAWGRRLSCGTRPGWRRREGRPIPTGGFTARRRDHRDDWTFRNASEGR